VTSREYVRSLEQPPPANPRHGQWLTEPATHPTADPLPTPPDATINVLKRRGYLTSMSPDEEVGYLARLVKQLHRNTVRSSPSYIFMPTYDCNLRCGYCFQDHMRTNPSYRHLLRTMQLDMVDRIAAAYATIEASHGI